MVMNENINIVKVTTSVFASRNVLRMVKEIKTLKRKTVGDDIFTDEMRYDPYTLAENIDLINLTDGLYKVELDILNIDYETGYADNWKLTLVQIES